MKLSQLYDFWFVRSGVRLRNLPFNWLPSDLGAGSLENSPKKAKLYVLKVKVIITQSSPTLCDPMDCSLPGSSAHEILQARILIPFSRWSSRPRGWTWVSCIAGRFFTIWATREACLKAKSSQRLSANHQKPEEKWNRFHMNLEQILSHNPQKERILLTLSSWISSLQNCETIHLYCLSHPGCGALLQQP